MQESPHFNDRWPLSALIVNLRRKRSMRVQQAMPSPTASAGVQDAPKAGLAPPVDLAGTGRLAVTGPPVISGLARSRPRVDYLATGGTIASVRLGDRAGAAPTLSAGAIAESAGIDEAADIRTHQFMQRASTSITFADLLGLRDEIRRRIADGSAGVVITQGTDTIEETAFVLDLLWSGEPPIVITGAMRNPSLPGADGPANLLAAVQVAASPQARGLGAVVVFNDEIHAARFVSKTHTSRLSTFQSPLAGPLGWVSEGRPVIATRPVGRFHVNPPLDAAIPPVALVRLALGDDGRIIPMMPGLGFRGAVIEGFGGGHVTPAMVPLLERLVDQMPVVLASRTGSGEVLSDTYRYPGSEIELLELGLIRAGALNGLKARVLLSLCLAADPSVQNVANAFQAIGMSSGPVLGGEPTVAVEAGEPGARSATGAR
jgi:L-asparaginase